MREDNKSNSLVHHGIPGMKWGIRRYQNKDGSLTAAGRRRANKLKDEYTELTGKKLIRKPSKKNTQDRPKTIQEMSDAELRAKTDRLNAEKNYVEAVNNHKAVTGAKTSKGKAIVDKFMKEMLEPAAMDVGKQLVKSYLVKATNDSLKLDNEYKVYTNNKKKN